MIKTKNVILYFLLLIGVFFVHRYITDLYDHFFATPLYFTLPFLLGLAYSIIFIPIMIIISKKAKVLSNPTIRSENSKLPTPLLGGMGICGAFICAIFTFTHYIPEQIKSIMIGGSIVLILGTLDDVRPLSSTIRLIGQITASFIVMLSGLIVSFTPNTDWGNFIAIIFTLLWILGITNAMNFLDGADGLASGIAIICSSFFFLIALHLRQNYVALISVIISGCCLGFLFFNFKPAKIYLGDGGSTFLGFVLACVALYGGWSNRGPVIAIGIPVIILGVLIFDMIYITAARIVSGRVRSFQEWLDYTGKDHFHHRLIHLGFDEKYAVLFIYIVCIVLGLGALTIEKAQRNYPIIIQLINVVLIFIIIMILMFVGRQTTNNNAK